MSVLRENWRVISLSVLLVLSVVALFGPAGLLATGGETEGATNLQYGIELDGGSRIRAPVNGYTVRGVDLTDNDPNAVERTVRQELGLDADDVVVSRGGRTSSGQTSVEVFPENRVQRSDFDSREAFEEVEATPGNVSRREVVRALQAANLSVSDGDVVSGVTERTLEQTRQVITNKISNAGLSGGSVQIARSGGEAFMVVQAPGREVPELRSLLRDEGEVEVVAYYQRNGSFVNETLIDQSMRDNFSAGAVREGPQTGQPQVPVEFTRGSEDTEEFVRKAGRISENQAWDCRGYNRFNYQNATPQNKCLLTVFDGEVIYVTGVQGGLARSWTESQRGLQRGEETGWLLDPSFVINVPSRERGEEVRIALQSGSLPATLDFESGDELSVEPALAQRFRLNSLITGIVAVIAVSLVVYFRYGQLRVAAPMVVTALSEVVVLLGFSAAVGYPLDLSVIAGFIAVIGTGVDDLIIIADEVMSEGDVNSRRVFDSRFRKAFWVIGAAAATTIIAMSPLAVLSLGDLQGFAIVTILGVVVGVTITRPAYGDILRRLTTGE
ncbi:preprotein translocase subunit SecD [Halobacteriales archaeon SW_7_71_33]|nr:MAG: preprotein translocase subunit SecD [Halobacteriales archaeon SW_7_71_33]